MSAQVLKKSLKNLDAAFNGFFKKKSKFPRFHSKHKSRQSFCSPQRTKVSNGFLYIEKFREGIKIRQHRDIQGKIENAVITLNKSGQYHVRILVEREVEKLPTNTNRVGIDFGITTLATCSNGTTYPNIRPYKTLEKRLKRLQRGMDKKKKVSSNRERARRKLAKLHQKIANIRSNHLHQITRKIVNENQVIIIEDLNVSGMVKNHKLAKSISDVSFGEFARQLKYKSEWYGRELIQVGRWYPSSKACNACGFINQDLKLSERTWNCPRCKISLDRDLNAAYNIRDEGSKTVGITGIACGENVSPDSNIGQFSVKHEAK